MGIIQCCQCHKEMQTLGNTWDEVPGWGCLYGALSVCSVECAQKFAKESSRYGELRDGDVSWSNPLKQVSDWIRHNLRTPCVHGKPPLDCEPCFFDIIKRSVGDVIPDVPPNETP